MNLNIHNVESVTLGSIEVIEHDDGKYTYVRRIIVNSKRGSFELNVFAKESDNIALKED